MCWRLHFWVRQDVQQCPLPAELANRIIQTIAQGVIQSVRPSGYAVALHAYGTGSGLVLLGARLMKRHKLSQSSAICLMACAVNKKCFRRELNCKTICGNVVVNSVLNTYIVLRFALVLALMPPTPFAPSLVCGFVAVSTAVTVDADVR